MGTYLQQHLGGRERFIAPCAIRRHGCFDIVPKGMLGREKQATQSMRRPIRSAAVQILFGHHGVRAKEPRLEKAILAYSPALPKILERARCEPSRLSRCKSAVIAQE